MVNKSVLARGVSVLVCLALPFFSVPGSAVAAGVYFVKDGDTLERVSRIFGVDAGLIREANELSSDVIATGDRIRIPNSLAKVVKPVEVSSSPGAVAATPEPAAEISRHHEVIPNRVLQAACREETVYHAVVRGDTLLAIAHRYGTELETVLHLNGLRKRSRLAIGQKIIVRKSAPRSHVVLRGETLSGIASRYDIEADEIERLNHLDKGTLTVGQLLLIQPCDPYATAGSEPPPLDGADSGLTTGGLISTPIDTSADSAPGDANPGFPAAAAATANRVVNFARTMLNVPYRFGGSTLRGIDCSAYVQRVFGLMDVRLPRTAREQYSVGTRIGRDDLQIGDLVFFRTYASYASHVGIYLGDELFIHASSLARRVAIDRIDLPYYRKRFLGARRFVVEGAPAVASTP